MLLCGLVGGVLALVAMFWRRDITWLIGLAMFPMFMILLYFLGLLLANL
jgi:hypothetical protein